MTCKNHPEIMERTYPCSGCGQSFCDDCLALFGSKKFCNDCKSEYVASLRSGVDHYELETASIGSRAVALLIDMAIIDFPVLAFLNYFFMKNFRYFSRFSAYQYFAITIGAISIVWLLYESILTYKYGGTIGKIAVKIKVSTPEGRNITLGRVVVRSLSRLLLGGLKFLPMPLLSLLGLGANYLPAFFSKKSRRCLHDTFSKTRVIRWNR